MERRKKKNGLPRLRRGEHKDKKDRKNEKINDEVQAGGGGE